MLRCFLDAAITSKKETQKKNIKPNHQSIKHEKMKLKK
jgi:hypothetical protein